MAVEPSPGLDTVRNDLGNWKEALRSARGLEGAEGNVGDNGCDCDGGEVGDGAGAVADSLSRYSTHIFEND